MLKKNREGRFFGCFQSLNVAVSEWKNGGKNIKSTDLLLTNCYLKNYIS